MTEVAAKCLMPLNDLTPYITMGIAGVPFHAHGMHSAELFYNGHFMKGKVNYSNRMLY